MPELQNEVHPLTERKRDRWFAVSLLVLWLLAIVNCAAQFTYVSTPGMQPYLVGLDQNGYFAYARSLLFDHDLNFANEYKFLVETQGPNTQDAYRTIVKENPRSPQNQFTIGSGLSALPLLSLTRAAVSVLHWVGAMDKVSGFASLYPFIYLLSNITLGVLALLATYAFLRHWFSAGSCAVATWAVLLCGPMLYYVYAEPGMSQLPGAFFTSAALLSWLRWRNAVRTSRRCIFAGLCGFCAVFAAVVRPYDVTVALILLQPASEFVWRVVRKQPGPRPRVLLAAYLCAAIGSCIAAAPQLIAWKIQHGKWVANTTDYHFYWWGPYALQVHFSRRHGLFFWAPALLIATVALLVALRRRPVAGWLLAIFAGVTLMAGSWWYYWIGVSFGMRTFVDLPVVFAFGFAAIAHWLLSRLGRSGLNIAWESVALFALINLHLIVCFRGGVITVDGPLFWLDTVSRGKAYKAQLAREWTTWTDWDSAHRANLLAAPPGY
jgi:hypothetical protein